MPTAFEPRTFRDALGKFATGVTIVTTLNEAGEPIGVTASSFNSVSLDPPLVLWSLARNAKSFSAFTAAGHFCVHVLASEQDALSARFAKAGEDKFAGIAWEKGRLGSPVLPDCAARFQCRTAHQYEGGDHLIFVGEVIDLETREKAPLVFHGGAYAEARARPKAAAGEAIDFERGRFTDEFLLYLLSRAHFQASFPGRREQKAAGLSEPEFLAMSLLSMAGQLSVPALADRLHHTGRSVDADTVFGLHAKGFVLYVPHTEEPVVTLSAAGRETFLALLVHAKALEERIAEHFTAGELADLKLLLKRLISATSAEIPELWT